MAAYVPWAMDSGAIRQITADARKELDEALRPWRRRFTGVQVADAVRLESPAGALVHQAADADLLVLGRRRQRPALAPRLGNVAHAAGRGRDVLSSPPGQCRQPSRTGERSAGLDE
ncbi:hypothetical protein ACFVFQ_38325 [Streptomyces sp. NPDC057743]|uniref:hypothetical protein n=1 Tax=Streptomyces sp. NPDC057743 TaxID=3346236 RepID=UPI003675CFF4